MANVIQFPSRPVTVDRDALDAETIADRIRADDEFASKLAALLALHRPELVASRFAYLDTAVQPRAPALAGADPTESQRVPIKHAPENASAESESDQLSALTTELVTRLAPMRPTRRGASPALAYVTLTAPPGRPVAPLLAFLEPRVLGAWLVIERAQNGNQEHAHGLLVAHAPAELVAEFCERHGLSPDGQCWEPVRGWRARRRESLRPHVFNVARYSLALGRYARKRSSEVPTAVLAWGQLAGTDVPSRFALDTAPTVTRAPSARLCACGCGAELPATRRSYLDDRHASRVRSRRYRADRSTPVTPVPVSVPTVIPPAPSPDTPPARVTVCTDTRAAVTDELARALDDAIEFLPDDATDEQVIRAAERVLAWIGMQAQSGALFMCLSAARARAAQSFSPESRAGCVQAGQLGAAGNGARRTSAGAVSPGSIVPTCSAVAASKLEHAIARETEFWRAPENAPQSKPRRARPKRRERPPRRNPAGARNRLSTEDCETDRNTPRPVEPTQ